MRWTEEEDDVLRAYGYEGAEGVCRRLWEECRSVRTPAAVVTRACRIKASLALRSVCPGCGATGVKINRTTGLCRKCSERQHLEEERALHEILERERAEAEVDSAELVAMGREREALRQANSRMCRKFGMTNRRDRERGLGVWGDGLSNEDIICALGIHQSTFYRWIGDPKNKLQRALSEGLKKEESEFKHTLLTTIRAAALARNQYWTAAAWLLERKYPDEYGKADRRRDDAGDGDVPRIVLGVVAKPVQQTIDFSALEEPAAQEGDGGSSSSASSEGGAA